MSDCSQLSDRMPLVALGRAEWTADEVHHLNDCESCQGEWKLLRMTSGLGEAAVGIDATATSRAVLQRLKHAREQRFRRRAWSFMGLAAAATVAAVVWTQRPVSRPARPPAASVVAGLQIPLPELDSLQPAELDSVLQTIDEPSVGDSTLDGTGLEDFLDSWEG